MEYLSRDTYQDSLTNSVADTNIAPGITNYLINKIKSHFCLQHDKKGYERFEQT